MLEPRTARPSTCLQRLGVRERLICRRAPHRGNLSSAVDCQRAYGQARRPPCKSPLHDADCLRGHRQEQPSLKNCFIGSGLNGLRVLRQLTTVF